MPTAPLGPCLVARCPGRAVKRGRCLLHAKEEQDAYEATRPSAADRGYDHHWRDLRIKFLAENPWCSEPDCRQLATDVDHVIAVKVAPEKRLDPDNLRAYCKQHHSAKTAKLDGRWTPRRR
jgi:5-methylcytosine-specific restriction enzyme A